MNADVFMTDLPEMLKLRGLVFEEFAHCALLLVLQYRKV